MVADYLRRRFQLSAPVRLERISRWQVTDEYGRAGGSLVGVVRRQEEACIFHTRALTTEDLIHELLHVCHPDWEEERVNRRTGELVTELLREVD